MVQQARLQCGIVFLIMMLWSSSILSQEFGGNPPSLKWRQINTDTARIIFPVGLEQQATDVARIIHRLAQTTQYGIGSTVRKINIVLQNQTTLSNGYVALGPYRSEFFLTPDPNSFELGSLPWHKTLALHEYRHVQQNNNFRKGLTRAFYYLFGEEGQALASDLAIPNWFWEGDAVFQETSMSRQGRGRIPFFFNDYRSIWAAGKNYSWMKLRNGSYRDQTPDHYRLGYMLVAYGREKYGDTVWARVTDQAARFKGLFYPFQKAVQHTTGESFTAFTNDAIQYFRKGIATGQDTPSLYAEQHIHFDADEEFPQWTDNDRFVYLKSSYKKIPAFFWKDAVTGAEKKIATRDISGDHYFSFRNHLIVYAAYRTDPRWGWRNYGVINVLDLNTGRTKTLTHRSKYFSPDISADGNTIVAVQMAPNGTSAIHFLDASSGRLLSVMPNPQQLVFTYPKFYKEGNVVAAVRNSKGEMALGEFNTATGNARWLTDFSMRVIGFPSVSGDTVCFTMSEDKQEKLFALINGDVYRFLPSQTNFSTGDYQLSVQGDKALYSAYTAVGYHVYVSGVQFEPVKEAGALSSFGTGYPLSGFKARANLLSDTSARVFTSQRYPSAHGAVHFHSWRPFISDPEYSYSLVGENILNTFQSELFVTYNRNERFKETGASLSYAGWFPVISGGASYTFDRAAFDNANRLINWNELNANIGLSVPLTTVHGSFSQNFNVSTIFNTQQVHYTGNAKTLYQDKKFNYGEVTLSAVNAKTTARQQIYPRFAQTFYARLRSALNRYMANQLLLSGSAYLPGISGNHSLVIQAAYQRRDTLREYIFTNSFPISRGYSGIDFPRMWKLGANYHFPIAYPDVGVGNVVYLLRLRGNVYYDYSQVKSLRTQTLQSFRSVGAELYVDSKWWNQLPISFGIRYSRLLDNDLLGRSPNQWELVLPLDLLSR